jgi:hypothetical protein
LEEQKKKQQTEKGVKEYWKGSISGQMIEKKHPSDTPEIAKMRAAGVMITPKLKEHFFNLRLQTFL